MTSRSLRQADYLSHMLEAAVLAQSYVEGMEKADFLEDKKTQQAIILNVMVIGEAAIKLADEYPAFIARFPQVEWRSMRGMRNRLAHGYFDINLEIVWDTVKQALPILEDQLRQIQKSQ
ncbi:MAG: DUF86 domain-containing protein [Nitrosomonadales bacterium]|nr:DUF86 domain-containing protein [Nitrosomonadales bacterium]MBK9162301.1 DUF86 domain-containing protein [Nitrosomonadales bacterium]